MLRPGATLFIPPLWCHAAEPLDGFSVAVNFFLQAESEEYALGNDIYGNRDIKVYTDARKDVNRIVDRFEDVAPETQKFYLSRLVQEFQEKIDSISA